MRPAIGLAAAIAVAAGAVAVGARFAEPDRVPVQPEVVSAPVIAPSAIGGEQPAIDGPASEQVAEREVTAPGAEGEAVAPVTRIVLDEMGGSADPLGTLRLFEEEAAAEAPATDGDPCAPRSGEPAADCPDGLESTVLALVSPRSLGLNAQAFPPTRADYLSTGNPRGALWCDGLVVDDDDVPMGILSTTPGAFTFDYWPTAEPDDVTTVTLESTAAEIAAFETALATAEEIFDVPLSQQCLVLPDLPDDTDYSARVTQVDIFDRVAVSVVERFNTEGAPTRPGAQIAVVGDNFVFASGLHTNQQSVDVRAWLYDDIDAVDCSGAGSERPLTAATHAESTVDRDFLASINALPQYTGKTVSSYRVPEGATLIVCVRWFPAGDSPSWERAQHDYESRVVLQSPDIILPVLTLADVRSNTDDITEARFSASSSEGGSCGHTAVYRLDVETELPATLCAPGAFVEGGIRVRDDRIWDVGFSGDLLLTSQIERTTGEEPAASFLMPLSRWMCRGECELPDTSWYTIRGWGGDSGDLDSVFRVDWTQGRQNGRADWNIVPASDSSIDYVVPETPQLNTENVATVTIDERTLSGAADYQLEVDRPVSFTARLLNAGGGAPCMADSSIPSTRTGTATPRAPARLYFSGLCLGETYVMQVELVDTATGRTTVWGFVDHDSWWGAASFIDVPRLDVTISYRWIAQGTTHTAMTELSLHLDHHDLEPVNGRGGACSVDGIVSGSDSGIEAALSSNPGLRFTIRLRTSYDFAPDDCMSDLRNLSESDLVEVSERLSLRDLLDPAGVIVEVPAARAEIHVWAYRR